MQDWRFDDLTRSLGKATSRRGVLKGLLGGVVGLVVGGSVAATAAADPVHTGGCSLQKCKDAALRELFFYENTTCNNLCHDRKLWLACAGCKINANRQYQKWLDDCKNGDGCLSVTGEVCCGSTCTDTSRDPNNCGSCGHACEANEQCVGGECQCGDDKTVCNEQCVDTQSDKHNCGACGHACATCEACVTGQCVPIECLDGQTCCQDTCVPLCLNGDQPDPTTCQCNNCTGQLDAAGCDENNAKLHCCHEQCVDTTCPSGKDYDYGTCSCQCTTTCPPGQLQDPVSCTCQDLCANKNCGECTSCDPTSGDCVPVDDQTACGTNQVCCNGTCQDTCGQQQCPSGQYACGVTQPYNPNNNNQRPDFWCCDNGSPCCGGNGYLYDVCSGSTYNDQYVCCQPGTNQCGTSCCDHVTQSCQMAGDYSLHCCSADAGGVLPDGTCCDSGSLAYACAGGGWACCAGGGACC